MEPLPNPYQRSLVALVVAGAMGFDSRATDCDWFR